MTKFRKILFGFFGLYVFAVLSLAQAQNVPDDHGPAQQMHHGQRVQDIFRQLNLTEDQKKQLEANKQQHRTKMQGIRREIKADRDALKAELMKPQLDMLKVNQIHDQIKLLQDQMEDERLNSILAVRMILTSEQFLRFTSMLDKLKDRRDEGDNHDR